jgi:hypothetical protein
MVNGGRNLRRSERIPCQVGVTWVRFHNRTEMVGVDASLHGLFLRTDATTAAGSLMKIEVTLPDGQPPIVLFVVARFVGTSASGRGIGCSIHVAADEDRARWTQYYRDQLAHWRAITAQASLPSRIPAGGVRS